MVGAGRAGLRRADLALRRRVGLRPPRERVVRFAGGLQVWADPADVVERGAWIAGTYEPATAAILGALLRPGDVAIDVGAHVGLHALGMARAVGADGLVLAFEPNPATVARLRRNVDLNGLDDRIRIHEVAASDRAGSSLLHLSDDPDNSGGASLEGQRTPTEAVAVPTAALDDVVGALAPRVAVVKLDVEGHEATALAGATAVLAGRPAVVLEANDLGALELLADLGYGLHEIGEDRLGPVVARDRVGALVRPGSGANVVAVVPRTPGAERLARRA